VLVGLTNIVLWFLAHDMVLLSMKHMSQELLMKGKDDHMKMELETACRVNKVEQVISKYNIINFG